MDLSNLSDDQLLQLIQSAMAETKRRGEAIIYAANQTVNDTAQDLRTKAAKSAATGQTARESVDDLAGDKAALVQALLEADWFSPYRQDQFSLSIWEKRGDVRV